MTRYSLTAAGLPSCPMCAAYGIETPTPDGDATAIDDGYTEPLVGVLCSECAAALRAGSDHYKHVNPGGSGCSNR